MNRPKLAVRARMYFQLVATGFGNGMRQYFSYRTQSAMRILGTVMEVLVWGILASLFVSKALRESLVSFYKTPDMVSFILSGLIINRLVDTAQLIDPFFFRRGYVIYHNRPFNMWVVAMAEAIDVKLFWNIVDLIVYLIFATLVFHIHINLFSIGFWLVVFLGALFKLGLALFTAGWNLVTKSGEDPINWFYKNTSRLFTGELIPVNVLWGLSGVGPVLRVMSLVHPKTYVLHPLRIGDA